MYVFLLAGCEVVASAFILSLGNFFCLKKKPEEQGHEARLEMAMSACETEELNHDGTDSGDALTTPNGDEAKTLGQREKMVKGLSGEIDGEAKPEKGL